MCPRVLEPRQMVLESEPLLDWDLHGVLGFSCHSLRRMHTHRHTHICTRTHTHSLQIFWMCHLPDKNISIVEENLMLIQKTPRKAEHNEKAAMTPLS